MLQKSFTLILASSLCISCAIKNDTHTTTNALNNTHPIIGTTEPFAEHAVYFLMTDRFVDGDKSNNFTQQGKPSSATFTFDRPLIGPNNKQANVGYLGGDFKGVANNAKYIKDLGFDAVWLTPIIDNPNEAFTGGTKVNYGGFGDQGKTGFHGYWGVNFYKLDEHLPSSDLDYRGLNTALKENGLKTVLDIVANHGSPAFSMPTIQPEYGKIYDDNNRLVADHENLHPTQLDKNNPLHNFYLTQPDLAELSDLDYNNPAVMDYLVGAYLKWIDQGVDALRIDTIRHMPHTFWKAFTDKIREKHPTIFMFGESFNYDANFIAQHTKPENGRVSVLDFPGRKAMVEVFENPNSDFKTLLSYLHLDSNVYQNPYELMTYYDSHDVKRLSANDNGFINANNWLFTARGIPVVYYGSEIGFERGTKEHEGNRNYYGINNIQKAKAHPIATALTRIANVRRNTPALQKGKQVNLYLKGHQAAFYRVIEHNGTNQTALVLLNKANTSHTFSIEKMLNQGRWQEALTGKKIDLSPNQVLSHTVMPNSVAVWIFDGKVNNQDLLDAVL